MRVSLNCGGLNYSSNGLMIGLNCVKFLVVKLMLYGGLGWFCKCNEWLGVIFIVL